MGSSRLPGKVLRQIGPKNSLERLFERLKACRRLDGFILATSTSTQDDVLEKFAQERGIPCYRGSESDVLKRVVEAHQKMKSDLIVEITGDCPLLDPEIIDQGIETFLKNNCDVVTNCSVPSYPQGIDVQVFRKSDLEKIESSVSDVAAREHVSLYFYENPAIFKIIHLIAPNSLKDPELRLQLDFPEDLLLIEKIYERLEPLHGPCFSVGTVLELLSREPDLRKINCHCKEKPLR